MAQANAAKRSAFVAQTISGNSPEIRYMRGGRSGGRQWTDTQVAHGVVRNVDTSTGAPKAGAFVYYNSSQVLEAWVGDMVATGYDTQQYKLVGLLMEDLPATDAAGNTKVAVAIANNDTIFGCSLTSSTATTTATVTGSLAGYRASASVNGSQFFLDRTIDAPSLVGSELFKIVDVVDADGTLNGVVLFQPRRGMFINDAEQI